MTTTTTTRQNDRNRRLLKIYEHMDASSPTKIAAVVADGLADDVGLNDASPELAELVERELDKRGMDRFARDLRAARREAPGERLWLRRHGDRLVALSAAGVFCPPARPREARSAGKTSRRPASATARAPDDPSPSGSGLDPRLAALSARLAAVPASTMGQLVFEAHAAYDGLPGRQARAVYLLRALWRRRWLERHGLRVCGCGCGERLEPGRSDKRHVNATHRRRAQKRRDAEKESRR